MNLIPKIAEALGVEIGEEFKIAGNEMNLFRFDEHRGLLVRINKMHDFEECASGDRYTKLLNGFSEIKKLPFEPKKGERYFIVSIVDDSVLNCLWVGNTTDYCYKACGNCFRTEAEAEKHKCEVYEKLTGKKWENTGESEEKS